MLGFKKCLSYIICYMTEDVDFDGTVDEVEEQIRDLEDPDYQSLLEQEKSNKDRKTIKEFIQNKMDKDEVEIEEEDVEDELVEEIEEDTAGGLLGGLSPEAVLAAGLAGGLVIGLLLGMVFDLSAGNADISAADAEDRVSSLYEGQFEGFEITGTEMRSGMYYISSNVSQEVEQENETSVQEFEQSFYLTNDGQYLFPEQRQFGQLVMPIDVDSQMESMREQDNQQEDLEDTNTSE